MEDDDDEIIELALAPVGTRVALDAGEQGVVRSISPDGTRMLVHLDGEGADKEVWVGSDDPWTLCNELDFPLTASQQPPEVERGEQDEEEAIDDDEAPMIENWRWTPDGALTGHVYGKAGYRDGEQMTTST